ncbi:MAG TPA: DUF2505 family protein [Acidimicrobiales bacterium]|nr:DUF2505 family protein [Acidimicrobiales bacterium]
MRFRLEQRFSAPLDAVEAAFVDPAVLGELAELPELGRPEILSRSDDGDTVTMDVRYAFVGELSKAVTAVIDPARLTWVEHSMLDRRTHRTALSIRPDHYADRLTCSATVTLAPLDGAGCRREVDGDLRVRAPLVASKVERAIVSGLRDHATVEGRVVQAWLDRHPSHPSGGP